MNNDIDQLQAILDVMAQWDAEDGTESAEWGQIIAAIAAVTMPQEATA